MTIWIYINILKSFQCILMEILPSGLVQNKTVENVWFIYIKALKLKPFEPLFVRSNFS